MYNICDIIHAYNGRPNGFARRVRVKRERSLLAYARRSRLPLGGGFDGNTDYTRGLVLVGIRQKTRTGYVNEYVHFCKSYLFHFFFFFVSRNRFGDAINGFCRGALVSEKPSRKEYGEKNRKIVIRIQAGGEKKKII